MPSRHPVRQAALTGYRRMTDTMPDTMTEAHSQGAPPLHDALALTAGGTTALIRLHDQTYSLRITRQGKLILTK